MSIKKIQQLRNITALGIMECKDALTKANGNIDLAIENLYSKGTIKYVKKDAKKLGFVNICLNEEKNSALIIEFNTQTDFVSKNQDFLNFVNHVTRIGLKNKIQNIEELLNQKFENKTIEQHQSILVNKFKENIHISRLKHIDTKEGILGAYVHNNKIAVVTVINKKIKDLAHDLAIHVAAMKPEYIKIEDIEKERIDKEKSILIEQVKEQHPKKNNTILGKIVEGKLNKLYQDIVLIKQTFVKDKNKTIENLLNENSCDITNMYRFEVSKD